MSYTQAEFEAAYQAWTATSDYASEDPKSGLYQRRRDTWERYCDIRDHLPIGTNRETRLRFEARERGLSMPDAGQSQSSASSWM